MQQGTRGAYQITFVRGGINVRLLDERLPAAKATPLILRPEGLHLSKDGAYLDAPLTWMQRIPYVAAVILFYVFLVISFMIWSFHLFSFVVANIALILAQYMAKAYRKQKARQDFDPGFIEYLKALYKTQEAAQKIRDEIKKAKGANDKQRLSEGIEQLFKKVFEQYPAWAEQEFEMDGMRISVRNYREALAAKLEEQAQ